MEMDFFFYLHSPEESNLRNLLEKFLGTSQEFGKNVNITNKINMLTSGSLYSLKLQLHQANTNMNNCISMIDDWDKNPRLLCWQLLQGRNSQHPTSFASSLTKEITP